MRWFTLIPAICAATPAFAAAECYDRIVTATIAAQVPVSLPEPADGSIVMHWPWFVDLVIEKPRGGIERITAQTLRHTYFRRGLRGRWLLRQNSMGSYNARWKADERGARRCARNAPPAQAYLGAENRDALDQRRREGEARYGVRN
ncbi:hypothetical protein [uncultured Sphingomonas sp.]|uniref:hypothetical protein n=1 Tax=uncultured Sphingomonas sp. TaxID=158754 RepID=UPI0025D42717|nr:hypothetical protein [uncultured Sphingomonas sp.]